MHSAEYIKAARYGEYLIQQHYRKLAQEEMEKKLKELRKQKAF